MILRRASPGGPAGRPRRASPAEKGLLLLVLASFAYVIGHLVMYGYLPQPFFWVLSDPLMDWFNPAYWAHRDGAYDVWRSVYPPLSFAFLRVFSLTSCYRVDSFFGRECDWLGKVALFGFYALNGLLLLRVYRRIDAVTAEIRTLAMVCGLPMLWGLERGNLIVPTFTCVVLGYSSLLRSARARWIAQALAINFKPYLLLLTLPMIARRRWRWLEGCAFATLGIYLLTYAIVGGGTPWEIAQHTKELAELKADGNWQDIYYATSYTPLLKFLTSPFPVMYYTGSHVVETLLRVLPLFIFAGQAGVALCLLGAWAEPQAVRLTRLAGLLSAVILTTSQPSGYAQIFLLFFVFMEPWRGGARIVTLSCAYLLCISWDYQIYTLIDEPMETWLGPRLVRATYGIAVGQFVRPGLLLLMQYALVVLTLQEQWATRRARLAPPPFKVEPASGAATPP